MVLHPVEMRKLLISTGQATRIKGGPGKRPVVETGVRLEEPVTLEDGTTVYYSGDIIERSIGNQRYPRLDELGVDWYMLKVTFSDQGIKYVESTLTQHTFGWERNEGFVFIDAIDEDGNVMTTKEFMKRVGVEITLKNLFKWSKRASRDMAQALKPGTFFSFPEHKARIVIEPRLDGKVWDGAMLINRKWLSQMWREHAQCPQDTSLAEFLGNFTQLKGTCEATVMTRHGQLKGHAIITDEDHVVIDGEKVYFDILYPDDVKTEHSKQGLVYIALKPVKGHDHMYLDIQSLVNLHEFLGVDRLLGYLRDENERVIDEMASGDFQRMLKRAISSSKLNSTEELQQWYLAEYCARGGHITWFAGMVRQAARQHLELLSHKNLKKMRLPIPGGRYYVVTSGVMEAAGVLKKALQKGECLIHDKSGRLIVNDEDWKEWFADVSGGADQDDGYWCVPFTDTDGKKKLLAWRSPNARGEYCLLKETVPFFGKYPNMDSSLLPPRLDTVIREYDELPRGAGYQGSTEYSLGAFKDDLERIQQNQGALETYINSDTLCIAHTGAPYGWGTYRQEKVIDYTVKEHGDCRPAKKQAEGNIRHFFVEKGNPISRFMVERAQHVLSEEEMAKIRYTKNLWLDRLFEGVEAEIASFRAQVTQLASQACPPIEVFMAGDKYRVQAAEVLDTYLEMRNNNQDWEVLREYVEGEVKKHGETILLGIAAEVYARAADRQRPAQDTILWLMGKENELGRERGIGNLFMEQMEQIHEHIPGMETGLLDRITVEDGEIVIKQAGERKETTLLKITQSWHRMLLAQNEDTPENPWDIPEEEREAAKMRLFRMAPKLSGLELGFARKKVGKHERLTAQRVGGNELGIVATEYVQRVNEQATAKIAYAYVRDGNLTVALM